jgi:hypothetical protein
MICKLSLESVPIIAVILDYSSFKKIIPSVISICAVFEYKFDLKEESI